METRGRRRSGLTFHRVCSTSIWGEARGLLACACDVQGGSLCALVWRVCPEAAACFVCCVAGGASRGVCGRSVEGGMAWGCVLLRLDDALMCPVAGATALELRVRRRSGLTFHRVCSTSISGEARGLLACACDVEGGSLCGLVWRVCPEAGACFVCCVAGGVSREVCGRSVEGGMAWGCVLLRLDDALMCPVAGTT